MDLAAWLSRIEQIHPQEIDLGLARVASVWQRLTVDLEAFVITVAGTNGKGSTVAALQSAALSNGIRVCAFTSPHILRYNERIRINGQSASDEIICRAFERIDAARGDISLSYFEFNTLAALLVAADAKVDLLLLEVGLGGRLDAVNIIDADMAVVTSIALDHEDWLGSDLEIIAAEKAGVSRQGRPVVVGEVPDLQFWSTFAARQGDTYFYGQHFGVNAGEWFGTGSRVALPALSIPQNSAAVALQVVSICPLFSQRQRAVEAILATRVFGRMQSEVWQGRDVLFDVAHNPASVALLVSRLGPPSRQFDILFGCMADKALQDMLPYLVPFAAKWWLPQLQIPRAVRVPVLAEHLKGEDVACFETMPLALEALQYSDRPLLVVGSFFTVSEAICGMSLAISGDLL
ncbi:MAG TPA: bifunctional tetrahydrofolate synthase/dihydrofolate synthase [Pseudomonadales bacterium]|nr:bifunctional tetrahydrofolate synthase/dihydrofolate synthase [Pseudomonadales bacterium]